MIFDKIENTDLYLGLNARINKVLQYIRNENFSSLGLGKHEIEGDDIFFIISEYDTQSKNGKLLESHKKYIDIQLVVEGEEQIGIASLSYQNPVKIYDPLDDYMLFDEPYSLITLKSGMFAVFFTDDLHLPGIKHKESTNVKKVVFKVKV